MSQQKKSSNLDELYQESNDIEVKDKSSSGLEKRKNTTIKFSAPKKSKKTDEDDVIKDEETLKKEEVKKREFILKIQDAFSPELMGELEEMKIMKKDLHLQKMSLDELEKTWKRIMHLNGSDHPRHFIYELTIGLAKKVESLAESYPMFKAPGFAKNLANNHLFKQKLHMWSLDRFDHTESSTEMTLAFNVLNEYQQARQNSQQINEQRELWGNMKVSEELIDQFSNL